MASRIKHPAEAGAFLLDWDGVLADTKLDFSPVRRKYFGGIHVPLLESAAALPEPQRAAVLAEINEIETEGAASAVPVDGAFELIAWLAENRKPWAVVSRNCLPSIVLAAERCGITLPAVTLSRESLYVKPDPRALALAAEKLNAALADCIMAGDFKYDLEAARNAAIPSVLVCKKTGADWETLADFSYDTVKDFAQALRFFKRDSQGAMPLGRGRGGAPR